MTTSAPIKREGDIPIILPEPEPKRLNPGIPAFPVVQPLKTPAKELIPRGKKCSN